MKHLLKTACCLVAAFSCVLVAFTNAEEKGKKDEEKDFVSLFDGKSIDGWKINENEKTWQVKDDTIICNGERSHLFYVGKEAPFKNFELRVDCKTDKNSNAGIYFHTKFQEEGWPKHGYESQVNNSHGDWKRTGSLYDVVNVKEVHVKDGEWWTQTVRVEGKHITVKINDKTVVDFKEDESKLPYEGWPNRRLSQGTFALQGHDPGSTVYFKNIRVKKLPD